MAAVITTTEESIAVEALGGASVVVVVPNASGHEEFIRCFASIERFTPLDTPVLVIDDQIEDQRSIDFVSRAAAESDRTYVVLRTLEALGVVRSCNLAFAATGSADVVLLRSDAIVGPGWLEGLQGAAASSNVLATVSALANDGHFLSTPGRNYPVYELPGGMSPETAASLVAGRAHRLYPTVPTAAGPCMLYRRVALRLLGGFDELFTILDCAAAEFGLRAVQHGLRNGCADDVFVYRIGRPESIYRDTQRRIDEEATIYARYRWYQPWLESEKSDLHSPLADAVVAAATSMRRLHFGVDARCLGPYLTGTQRLTLETIKALARVEDVDRLRVFLPGELPVYAKKYLDGIDFIDLVPPAEFGRVDRQCDVIYRPFQVNHPDELDWLRAHGHRVIVNQLDAISFHDAAYATSFANWDAYRELTKLTLATVDGIAFISEQARDEVVTAGLVGDDVPTSVVWCGADSEIEMVRSVAPVAFPDDGRPLLVCLGHSYHHKNRVWAIKLFERLADRGWNGRLVLAGPNPPDGNSLAAEAGYLVGRRELSTRVTTLGSLADAEKQWLMDRAALVLYPSLVEGFGLIPFEAAMAGVPVLSTRQGSLDEILPTDIPTIDDLDLDTATEDAWRLLHEPADAAAVVDSLRRKAKEFTWDDVAVRIVALANETLARRTRSTVALDAQHLIGWYSNIPLEPVDDTSHALRYWLEQLVRTKPGGMTVTRALVPEGSKRQTAVRQFVNYLRRRFSGQ